MHKKKRGASMIVSYALLIVIAIGLSAIVYPFLKARLPIDNVECPSDLSLSIEEVSCDLATQSINLTMLNRGLFNITGAYVRFAEASKSIRPQVNEGKEAYLKGYINDFSPLAPGQYTALLKYQVGNLSVYLPDSDFVVEVQPAIFKKGVMVPCANKIITQTIKCTSEV